jgi:PRTRC genetic system protein A
MVNLPSPIKYHIYTGQDLPPTYPYAYVVAANGVYKVADTPRFYASIRIASARVAGLARWPESGVLLRVPRVPGKWLAAALGHARNCGSGGGRGVMVAIEQMYHFHLIDGGWRVSVPRQDASAGRVSYRGGSESTIVLDLHSHHEMAAFFSGTDNADAQGCRFDAVIGRIYSRPEIRLRLALYGDFVELPAGFLFEDLGEFVDAGRRSAGLAAAEYGE